MSHFGPFLSQTGPFGPHQFVLLLYEAFPVGPRQSLPRASRPSLRPLEKRGVMTGSMPVLRQVPAEILCTLGWVYGTLHMPAHQTLHEFLSLSGPSIKLTRVRIPREHEALNFLALRRQGISVIAPPMGEPTATTGPFGPTTTREIACLLSDEILRGSLQVPTGLRLSDYLRQEGPFLTLRRCLMAPYGATLQSPGAKTLDVALVNLEHLAGVSETG